MHGGKCTTFFRIPGILHLHFEYILKTPSLIFKYLQSIRNRKIIEKSFLSESWVNTAVIAMPAASFATILCLKYDKDMTTVSSATFLTCLLSIVTIPLISLLFHI